MAGRGRRAFSGCLFVVALGAGGCAATDVQRPFLAPIEDAVFTVDQPGSVRLVASSPSATSLGYRFELDPPPATSTMGAAGQPRLVTLPDGAVFTWTPGVADARGSRQADYRLLIDVSDDAGGRTRETINLTVSDPGVDRAAPVRFVSPAGAGLAVSGPCAAFDVEVRTETFSPDEVELTVEPATFEGCVDDQGDCLPTLTPPGPGLRKGFLWCPSAAQLTPSSAHTLTFGARAGDVVVEHQFLLLFDPVPTNCMGQPPTIAHRPPPRTTARELVLDASITDEHGLDGPPTVGYFFDPPLRGEAQTADGRRHFRIAPMEAVDEQRWRLRLPVIPPEGGSTTVYYIIQARGDDDTEGEACDHEATAGVFTARVDDREVACQPDRFEVKPPPGVPEPVTHVEPGLLSGLSICGDDTDTYRVPVAAGDGLDVTLTFDGSIGDLDLFAALPGEATYSLSSVDPVADEERIRVECMPVDGLVEILVAPYDGAENAYTLDLELRPDGCADAR